MAENTSEATIKRLREEADAESYRTVRAAASKRVQEALEALLRGEDVDLELVGKVKLVDVMLGGEDKDAVNAARVFQAPRKAKEEPREPDAEPGWLADPEAAKPVTGGGEGGT